VRRHHSNRFTRSLHQGLLECEGSIRCLLWTISLLDVGLSHSLSIPTWNDAKDIKYNWGEGIWFASSDGDRTVRDFTIVIPEQTATRAVRTVDILHTAEDRNMSPIDFLTR